MKKFILATIAATAMSGSALATTINFDDGAAGSLVGNFYAAQGVVFSNAQWTSNFGLPGTSGGLGISAPGTFEWGSDSPVVGTFASPVSSVTIRGIDVGQAGFELVAFNAADEIVGTSTSYGPDVGIGYYFDETVTGAGITSFEIFQPATSGGSNPYGDGVLADNLSFSAGVPEPAAWATILLGVGLAGGALRRSRRQASAVA